MADPRSFNRDQSADAFSPHTSLQTPGGGGTFIAAPAVTDGGLGEGIKALAGIEPALGAFVEARSAEQKERDTTAGRDAALVSAMEHGEAVRTGRIPANQSKWFMIGYKHQYGEVLGEKWTAEAKAAWAVNPDRNSDSPGAADEFIRKFTEEKLASGAGADPYVRSGLTPKLAHMQTVIRTAQAEWSAKQVTEKNLENFGQLVSGDIDAFINGRGAVSEAQLREAITARDRQARLMGVDNDAINKEIVQAFVNKARETGSFAMLKTLRGLEHIGNNPKYGAAIRVAEDAIVARAASNESRAWTAEQRADKVAAKAGLSSAMGWIIENPGKPLPDELRRVLNRIDPKALVDAEAYRNTDSKNHQQMTPAQIYNVERQVHAAGLDAENVAGRLILSGAVPDPAEAKRILAESRAVGQITSEKEYTNLGARVKELATTAFITGKEVMLDPQAIGDGIYGAEREYIRWRRANPMASDMEKHVKAEELQSFFIKQIKSYSKISASLPTDYDGAAGNAPGTPRPPPPPKLGPDPGPGKPPPAAAPKPPAPKAAAPAAPPPPAPPPPPKAGGSTPIPGAQNFTPIPTGRPQNSSPVPAASAPMTVEQKQARQQELLRRQNEGK